jgi:hypothetical protein
MCGQSQNVVSICTQDLETSIACTSTVISDEELLMAVQNIQEVQPVVDTEVPVSVAVFNKSPLISHGADLPSTYTASTLNLAAQRVNTDIAVFKVNAATEDPAATAAEIESMCNLPSTSNKSTVQTADELPLQPPHTPASPNRSTVSVSKWCQLRRKTTEFPFVDKLSGGKDPRIQMTEKPSPVELEMVDPRQWGL